MEILMTLQEITFTNSKGHAIAGMLRYSEPIEPVKYPAIIVLHGFNEHMRHDLTADLANGLVHYGFLTLRFDFHGHGDSEGEFENHTITQQIDDVISALDYLSAHELVDPDRISVVGTDIGGNIAMLAAAKDARIKCIVAQGARSHFDKHLASHFQKHDMKELMGKGFYDHSQFRIRKEYVRSANKHDIQDILKEVHAPLLILHGVEDFRVTLNETRELFSAANEPRMIEEVDGADHWFRGEAHRETFIELAAQWIRRWTR